MKNALIGTVTLGAIATFGDWVWATFLSEHIIAAGLVHGALLCLAMGAMVGRPARRTIAGAIGGAAIGLIAAGLFYLLAPMMGYGAMFPAWFALWVLMAVMYHVLARGTLVAVALTRGAIAGVASGLAFYLISGMWIRWDPQSIDYLDHMLRWTFAFAPGFLALQGGRSDKI
jgi:hypothetical protein